MKVVVIKSDVAYAIGLPSDVSPVIKDIIAGLDLGIALIEAVGTLTNVVNGVPFIKGWEDMKGQALGRKAIVYNTIYIKRMFVEEKEDRAIWSKHVPHWLKVARERFVSMGDLAPALKELSVKAIQEGWNEQSIIIKCANCGGDIPGIRRTKKARSIFTPSIDGVTKGEGVNCRKWYCPCTKTGVAPTPELKKVEDELFKADLSLLRIDYAEAQASIKKLENMVSKLEDKLNDPNLVTKKLTSILTSGFLDMDKEAILAFIEVINWFKFRDL